MTLTTTCYYSSSNCCSWRMGRIARTNVRSLWLLHWCFLGGRWRWECALQCMLAPPPPLAPPLPPLAPPPTVGVVGGIAIRKNSPKRSMKQFKIISPATHRFSFNTDISLLKNQPFKMKITMDFFKKSLTLFMWTFSIHVSFPRCNVPSGFLAMEEVAQKQNCFCVNILLVHWRKRPFFYFKH